MIGDSDDESYEFALLDMRILQTTHTKGSEKNSLWNQAINDRQCGYTIRRSIKTIATEKVHNIDFETEYPSML